MRKNNLVVGGGAVLLLLLVGIAAAETFTGELTQQEPKKAHPVKMEKGTVYQIDMISKAFDAFLRLKDAAGTELAKDDDGGEGYNARLVFTPPASGNYTLSAESFEANAKGGYLLSIKELAEIKLGQTVTGKIGGKSSKLNKVVYESYVIQLVSPKTYQIDQKSKEIDSILAARRVGDAKNEAEDDDSGGGKDARLMFTPKTTGFYELRCGSFDGSPGEFTLSIVEK